MRFRLLLGLFFLFYSWVSLYAEIRVIPDRQYFNIVQEELSQAKESIEVEMYLAYSDSPPVKELLDEMIEAKKRGVKVKVILEDGQEENKLTAEYLKNRGVVAEFDEPEVKLHAKLIQVDGKKLIIGSSNWTKKAFSENNESNVMVGLEEDKDKARELATRINEPYDPEVVASLIMLAKIYGPEAVRGAIATATKLSFENGKWEMRYIIGILQKNYAPLK